MSSTVGGAIKERTLSPLNCACRSKIISGISLALLLSGTLLLAALLPAARITTLFQQTVSSSTSSTSTITTTSTFSDSVPPQLVASDQNPTSSSCGVALDPTMRGDVDPGGDAIGDYDVTGTTAVPGGDSGKTSCRSNSAGEATGHCTRVVIPFFGRVDDDTQRSSWSHLNHRLEEYRQDLVKVVQSLDMIINKLERTATEAEDSADDKNMPGEGMRRLAAKLRRKLDKTPPRWQVNIDVLSWLLRPVPFVVGLPAPLPAPPTPIPFVDNNDYDGNINSNNNAPAARDRKTADGVVVPSGGVSDDENHAPEVARAKTRQAGEEFSGSDALRESPSVLGSASVGERRAVPVPVPNSYGAGGGSGEGAEKEGPRNRAGFHSYDETHQIFTHILRDWTSEGDSVRAAVYDPLLKALDEYFGGRGEATATNDSEGASDGSSGRRGDAQGDSFRCSDTREQGWWRDQPEPQKASNRRAFCTDRPRTAKVLVPGAGLGRLAAEIAARGYASVHANELSATMLSSCYWLMEALRGTDFTGTQTAPGGSREEDVGVGPSLSPPPGANYMLERDSDGIGRDGSSGQGCRDSDGGDGGLGADGGGGEGFARVGGGEEEAKGFFKFYPFLNDAAHNEMDGEARFRSVLFPDPGARTVLARASGKLSFQAGEFSATYGGVGGPYEGAFDAVVTSFFVDTAPDVVQYVATIRRALRPGGAWINCGPLHWHNPSALALSLDEILLLVAGSGFRLEAVEQLPPSAYRVEDGGGSLRVDEFRPVFWIAILEGGQA